MASQRDSHFQQSRSQQRDVKTAKALGLGERMLTAKKVKVEASSAEKPARNSLVMHKAKAEVELAEGE